MAVEQMDDAMRVSRVVRVVRHHDDCGAVFVQFGQQIHDLVAVCRVEITRWLVCEDDVGVCYDGSGYGYALLLTAG